MTALAHGLTKEDYRLAQPVRCVGFTVVTATTDFDGRITYNTSPAYRTRLKADQVTAAGRTELRSWERQIAIAVQECQTSFPLSDVLAGKATRWTDYRAALKASRGVCDYGPDVRAMPPAPAVALRAEPAAPFRRFALPSVSQEEAA